MKEKKSTKNHLFLKGRSASPISNKENERDGGHGERLEIGQFERPRGQ